MNSEARPALKPCDIIMKGGITSGVVYPQAILRLSEKFQFRSIGGTSAGAIAAVLTAAAEYNRAGGGFETIKSIPNDIRDNLESLFQASPEVATVFAVGKLVAAKRFNDALKAFVAGYWPGFAALLIALVGLLFIGRSNGWAALLLVILGAFCGVVLIVGWVVWSLLRTLAGWILASVRVRNSPAMTGRGCATGSPTRSNWPPGE